MSKSKNDLMLKYLKENDPNIFEVKSIGLKDWDDDDGPMGEHYIVEVIEYWMNPEILGHDMRGSKYLVDKSIFELWNKQKNAIKKLEMYTLNKSKEQHPMIRPGKYKGLQSAYYLTILFDNGNKSEPIEMEGGVRGLDCSMDVTVSVDGTITAS